jgi:hypothetical protein
MFVHGRRASNRKIKSPREINLNQLALTLDASRMQPVKEKQNGRKMFLKFCIP